MKCYLSLILIVIVSSSSAQQEFGIKVEGGASIIATNNNEVYINNPLVDPAFFEYKDQWTPSYNLGFSYSIQFSRRSEISAEVKFSQIQSTIVYSNIYDNVELKSGIRISYISFPIYYGFKISKFTPSLGFRFSLLINDRSISYESSYNGETHDEIGTDQMDYGPQVGLTFDLSEKFAIETFYYHGINNLVNWGMVQFQNTEQIWKIRQVTLGFKYTFSEWHSN